MLLKFVLPSGILLLMACNAPTSRDPNPSVTEDRFHEKSFSWDDPNPHAGLAKVSARATRFESDGELHQAVVSLEEKLRRSDYADSLWKPIDHACDELSLALWNAYGTVRVRDSVVFDESTLKADCRYIGEDPARAKGVVTGSRLEKSAAVYPTAVETDRQYPYKMIGESWDDFNIGVYKSTGGETQFKKRRERFGVMGWYDTDASRIGVRIYLADCSVNMNPRTCVIRRSTSDWYSNDDYVSKREAAAGAIVEYPLGGALMNLRVADAVLSLHSADHAGLQFRTTSSSGFTANTQLISPLSFDYVTW